MLLVTKFLTLNISGTMAKKMIIDTLKKMWPIIAIGLAGFLMPFSVVSTIRSQKKLLK